MTIKEKILYDYTINHVLDMKGILLRNINNTLERGIY